MYPKKIYYPHKIIYMLVLFFRDPNILVAYITFCVYFTMFSPQNNSCDSILECIVRNKYAHSHKAIKTNGYLDRQWYDHTNTMKDGQL
jgi:hypothetical protein